jgi:hypothetical protein
MTRRSGNPNNISLLCSWIHSIGFTSSARKPSRGFVFFHSLISKSLSIIPFRRGSIHIFSLLFRALFRICGFIVWIAALSTPQSWLFVSILIVFSGGNFFLSCSKIYFYFFLFTFDTFFSRVIYFNFHPAFILPVEIHFALLS